MEAFFVKEDIRMDCKLDGKIAVVTGGAQGIGLAAVEALACEGAIVISGDLGFEKRLLKKEAFEGRGAIYSSYLDVSSTEAVEQFFELIVKQFGTVDIFYSNAGICKGAMPFEDTPLEVWDTMCAGCRLVCDFIYCSSFRREKRRRSF